MVHKPFTRPKTQCRFAYAEQAASSQTREWRVPNVSRRTMRCGTFSRATFGEVSCKAANALPRSPRTTTNSPACNAWSRDMHGASSAESYGGFRPDAGTNSRKRIGRRNAACSSRRSNRFKPRQTSTAPPDIGKWTSPRNSSRHARRTLSITSAVMPTNGLTWRGAGFIQANLAGMKPPPREAGR